MLTNEMYDFMFIIPYLMSILSYFFIDVNECLSSPCQFGATCHDDVNGYHCQCADGYTGVHCETGEFD